MLYAQPFFLARDVPMINTTEAPRQTDSAEARRWLGRLVLFLLVLSVVRIAYLAFAPIGLSPDEAHYWEWSRRLGLCYYSKGPAVAYLIRAGTILLGSTELGVRLPAVVLSALSSLALFGLGCRLVGARSAAWAAGVLQIIPLFALISVGMTTDMPLLLCWILALWAFQWARVDGPPWAWLLVGLAAAAGVLTKYVMVLFAPAALLLLLMDPKGRKQLLSPWPWLGAVIAALGAIPLLLWNARHDWVNLRHNLGHTHVDEGVGISLASFGEFLGSQFGVITPILLVFMAWAVWRQRRTQPLCFWFTFPLWAFFLLKSLQGKVQANWAMVSYPLPLLCFVDIFAVKLDTWNKHVRRLVVAGVLIALIASAALYSAVYWPLEKKNHPARDMMGWEQLGREIEQVAQQANGEPFYFADRYSIASPMAFYVPSQPMVYCINRASRMNQYDIWPGFEEDDPDLIGRDAIYLPRHATQNLPDELQAVFSSASRHPITLTNPWGDPLRTFTIFLCRDYRGGLVTTEADEY